MKPVVGHEAIKDLMAMNNHAMQTGQTPQDLLAEYGINGDDIAAWMVASGIPSAALGYILGSLLLGVQLAGLPEFQVANNR
jgi:hypothetical protein